ncbi:MAG: hypothetical protein WDW36_000548 [Sanguina aurantia]
MKVIYHLQELLQLPDFKRAREEARNTVGTSLQQLLQHVRTQVQTAGQTIALQLAEAEAPFRKPTQMQAKLAQLHSGPRKWKRQSPALQKAAARLDATRLERSTTDRDKLLRFIGLCDHLVLAQLCSLARSALALCLSELTQPRKVGLFLMVGYVDESAAAAAAARSAVATASSVSAAQQHSAWTRQTGDSSPTSHPILTPIDHHQHMSSHSSALAEATAVNHDDSAPSRTPDEAAGLMCFRPAMGEVANTVGCLPRELLAVVLAACQTILTSPEVRCCLNDIGAAADAWVDQAAAVRNTSHHAILRGTINVPELQVMELLSSAVAADYRCALGKPGMGPYMGHLLEYGLVASFSAQDYAHCNPAPERVHADILSVQRWAEDLSVSKPITVMGLLQLDATALRTTLLPVVYRASRGLLALLGSLLTRQAAALVAQLHAHSTALVQRPTGLPEFVRFVEAIAPHLAPHSPAGATVRASHRFLTQLFDIFGLMDAKVSKRASATPRPVSMFHDGSSAEVVECSSLPESMGTPAEVRALQQVWGEMGTAVNKYQEECDAAVDYHGLSLTRMSVALTAALRKVDADLTAVLLRLRTGASSDPRADPALVRQELEGLGAALEEARQEGEKLGGWSKTLAQEGLAPPVQATGTLAADCRAVLAARDALWKAIVGWSLLLDRVYDAPCTSSISAAATAELEAHIARLGGEVAKISSRHVSPEVTSLTTATPQEATMAAHYSLVLRSWDDMMPVVRALGGGPLLPRHVHMLLTWLQTYHTTSRQAPKAATHKARPALFARQHGPPPLRLHDAYPIPTAHVDEDERRLEESASGTTLAQLLSRCTESPETRQLVTKAVAVAAEEHRIQLQLRSIQRAMASTQLAFSKGRTGGAHAILGLPEVLLLLQGWEAEVRAIAGSPYVGGVLGELEVTETLLAWVYGVFTAAHSCQRQWLFLCAILLQPAVATQVPHAADGLEAQGVLWRKAVRLSMQQSGLPAAAGVLQLSGALEAEFEKITSRVSPVLGTMRLHYPRLHFVSDRALLEGLALAGQPSELPRSLLQGVLTGLVGFEIRAVPSLPAEERPSTAGRDGGWTLGSETGGSEGEGGTGAEARCAGGVAPSCSSTGDRLLPPNTGIQAPKPMDACAPPTAPRHPPPTHPPPPPPPARRATPRHPLRPTHPLPHHPHAGPHHGPPHPAPAHDRPLMVAAVRGASGERLQLLQAVDAGSGRPLEAWLRELERATQAGAAAATRRCMASCGVMQADDWVSSFPSISILLVDSVVFTQSAHAALTRLQAGQSIALRSLLDQTVLRLETIGRQLRGALLLPAVEDAHSPATASRNQDPLSTRAPQSAPPSRGSSPPAVHPAGHGGGKHGGQKSKGHAAQTPLPTETAVESLIAGEAEGPGSFEWLRQVRHAWDPETGALTVSFAQSAALRYGWEYDGNGLDCVTLTSPMSMDGLLASISALGSSPVVSLPMGCGLSNADDAMRGLTSLCGRYHATITCAADTSAAGMNRLVGAAVSIGCWVSIKGMDLLSLQVLSCVGQALHELVAAYHAAAPFLHINRHKITSPWLIQPAPSGPDSATANRSNAVLGPAARRTGSGSGAPPRHTSLGAPVHPWDATAFFVPVPLPAYLPCPQERPGFSAGESGDAPGGDKAPWAFLAEAAAAAAGQGGGGRGRRHHAELSETLRRLGRAVTLQPADPIIALEAGLRCMGLRDAGEAAHAVCTIYKLAAAQLHQPQQQYRLEPRAVRSILVFVKEQWMRASPPGSGGGGGGGGAAGSSPCAGPVRVQRGPVAGVGEVWPKPGGCETTGTHGGAAQGTAGSEGSEGGHGCVSHTPSPAAGSGAAGHTRVGASAVDGVEAALGMVLLAAAHEQDAGVLRRLVAQVIKAAARTPPIPEPHPHTLVTAPPQSAAGTAGLSNRPTPPPPHPPFDVRTALTTLLATITNAELLSRALSHRTDPAVGHTGPHHAAASAGAHMHMHPAPVSLSTAHSLPAAPCSTVPWSAAAAATVAAQGTLLRSVSSVTVTDPTSASSGSPAPPPNWLPQLRPLLNSRSTALALHVERLHTALSSARAVLLVGPPGAGKTLVWKAYVAATHGPAALLFDDASHRSSVCHIFPELIPAPYDPWAAAEDGEETETLITLPGSGTDPDPGHHTRTPTQAATAEGGARRCVVSDATACSRVRHRRSARDQAHHHPHRWMAALLEGDGTHVQHSSQGGRPTLARSFELHGGSRACVEWPPLDGGVEAGEVQLRGCSGSDTNAGSGGGRGRDGRGGSGSVVGGQLGLSTHTAAGHSGKIAQSYPSWVVFDGPLGSSKADACMSLVLDPGGYKAGSNGVSSVALRPDCRAVWECCDVSRAAPAVMAALPLVYVGYGVMDEAALVEKAVLAALQSTLLAPGTATALARRFSTMMVAVLTGAASALAQQQQQQQQQLSEAGAYPQVGLAGRLTALFAQASSELALPAQASGWRRSSLAAQLTPTESAAQMALGRAVIFTLFWSIAALVMSEASRATVEDVIRQQAEIAEMGGCLPPAQLGGVLLCPKDGVWLPWSDAVTGLMSHRRLIRPMAEVAEPATGHLPSLQHRPSGSLTLLCHAPTRAGANYHFFPDAAGGGPDRMFVPDPVALCLQYVAALSIHAGLQPLLVGPHGSGRRTLLRHLLATGGVHPQWRTDVMHLTLGPRSRAQELATQLRWHLYPGASSTLRPPPGHKLVVLVEDLHAAAHGAGSRGRRSAGGGGGDPSPAGSDVFPESLEWLRQVLDTGGSAHPATGARSPRDTGARPSPPASGGTCTPSTAAPPRARTRTRRHPPILTTAVFERLPQQPHPSAFSLPDVLRAACHHAMARLGGAGVAQPSPLPLAASSVLLAGALTNVYCAIRGLVDAGVLPCLWAFEAGPLLASLARTCDAAAAVNAAQRGDDAAVEAGLVNAQGPLRRERSEGERKGSGGDGGDAADGRGGRAADGATTGSESGSPSRAGSERGPVREGGLHAPSVRAGTASGAGVAVEQQGGGEGGGGGEGEGGVLELRGVMQRLMFDVGMTLLGSLAGKGQREVLSRVLLAAVGNEIGTLLRGDTGQKASLAGTLAPRDFDLLLDAARCRIADRSENWRWLARRPLARSTLLARVLALEARGAGGAGTDGGVSSNETSPGSSTSEDGPSEAVDERATGPPPVQDGGGAVARSLREGSGKRRGRGGAAAPGRPPQERRGRPDSVTWELMRGALSSWGYGDIVPGAAAQLGSGFFCGGHVLMVGADTQLLAHIGALAAISCGAALVRLGCTHSGGTGLAARDSAATDRARLLLAFTRALGTPARAAASKQRKSPTPAALGMRGRAGQSQGEGEGEGSLLPSVAGHPPVAPLEPTDLHVVVIPEHSTQDGTLLELLQQLLCCPASLARLSADAQSSLGIAPQHSNFDGPGLRSSRSAAREAAPAAADRHPRRASDQRTSFPAMTGACEERSVADPVVVVSAAGAPPDTLRGDSLSLRREVAAVLPASRTQVVSAGRQPHAGRSSEVSTHRSDASGTGPGARNWHARAAAWRQADDGLVFAQSQVQQAREAEGLRREAAATAAGGIARSLRVVLILSPARAAAVRARHPALAAALTLLTASSPTALEQQDGCIAPQRPASPQRATSQLKPNQPTSDPAISSAHRQVAPPGIGLGHTGTPPSALSAATTQGAGAPPASGVSPTQLPRALSHEVHPAAGEPPDAPTSASAERTIVTPLVAKQGSGGKGVGSVPLAVREGGLTSQTPPGRVEPARRTPAASQQADQQLVRRLCAVLVTIHAQAQALYRQAGLLAPGLQLPHSKMQDMVEALSKIHSAHRKLMVAQRASLWVCLRKLTGGGGQLATCEQAILASHSATKRHDEALVTVGKKIVTLEAFISGVELELSVQDAAASEAEELIGDLQAGVDAEIAGAQTRYNAAIEEVGALSELELAELRTYHQPHERIKLVLMAVAVLFDWPSDWRSAQRLMNDKSPNLVDRVRLFSPRHTNAVAVSKLHRIVREPEFNIVLVGQVSKAAKSLCWWALCVSALLTAVKEADLKMSSLAEGRQRLANTVVHCRRLRGELAGAVNELGRQVLLREELEQSRHEATAQATDNELQIGNMKQLEALLAPLRVQWEHKVADIERHLPTLIGDATITAASVVYLGPFSCPQRASLQQAWAAALRAASVPVQPVYSFDRFMAIRAPQASMLGEWTGLDDAAIARCLPSWRENLLLMALSARPPLMYDPAEEGAELLREMFGHDSRVPFTLTDGSVPDEVGRVVGGGGAAVVSLYGLPREPPLVERLAVRYRQAMRDTVRSPQLRPHRLYLRLLSGPTAAPLTHSLHTHFMPVRFTLQQDEVVLKLRHAVLEAVDFQGLVRLNMLQTQAYQQRMELLSLSCSISNTIAQTHGPIWRNPGLVDATCGKALRLAVLQQSVPKSEAEIAAIEVQLERWAGAIAAGSLIHGVLSYMSRSDRRAILPDQHFLRIFKAAVRKALQQEAAEAAALRERELAYQRLIQVKTAHAAAARIAAMRHHITHITPADPLKAQSQPTSDPAPEGGGGGGGGESSSDDGCANRTISLGSDPEPQSSSTYSASSVDLESSVLATMCSVVCCGLDHARAVVFRTLVALQQSARGGLITQPEADFALRTLREGPSKARPGKLLQPPGGGGAAAAAGTALGADASRLLRKALSTEDSPSGGSSLMDSFVSMMFDRTRHEDEDGVSAGGAGPAAAQQHSSDLVIQAANAAAGNWMHPPPGSVPSAHLRPAGALNRRTSRQLASRVPATGPPPQRLSMVSRLEASYPDAPLVDGLTVSIQTHAARWHAHLSAPTPHPLILLEPARYMTRVSQPVLSEHTLVSVSSDAALLSAASKGPRSASARPPSVGTGAGAPRSPSTLGGLPEPWATRLRSHPALQLLLTSLVAPSSASGAAEALCDPILDPLTRDTPGEVLLRCIVAATAGSPLLVSTAGCEDLLMAIHQAKSLWAHGVLPLPPADGTPSILAARVVVHHLCAGVAGRRRALALLGPALEHGHWLVLMNAHLAPEALVEIQEHLNGSRYMAAADATTFRLFLAMPHSALPGLPASLLYQAVQIVLEPPVGIAAYVRGAMQLLASPVASEAAFFSRNADLELHKLGLGWAITAGAIARTTSALALALPSSSPPPPAGLPTPLSNNDFLHGMRALRLALDEARRVDDSSLDHAKILDLIVSDVLLPCAPSPQLASHFVAIATQALTPHVLTLRYPVHSPVTRHREGSDSVVLTPHEVACLQGHALLRGTSRADGGTGDGQSTAAPTTTYSVVPLPMDLRLPTMLDFLGTLDGMEEVLLQKPAPGSLTATNSVPAADGGAGFPPAWQNTAWDRHVSRSCTLLLQRLPATPMGDAEPAITAFSAAARVFVAGGHASEANPYSSSTPAPTHLPAASGAGASPVPVAPASASSASAAVAASASRQPFDVAGAPDEQAADEVSTQQLRGVLAQLLPRIRSICASTCLSLEMLSRHSLSASAPVGGSSSSSSSSRVSLTSTTRSNLGSARQPPTQEPVAIGTGSSAQAGACSSLPKLPGHLHLPQQQQQQRRQTPAAGVSLDTLLLDFWTQEARLLHDAAARAARDARHVAAAAASPELRADGGCNASTAAAALLMHVVPASWALPSPGGVNYACGGRGNNDSGPSSTSTPLWAWCADMEARAAVLLSVSGLKPKEVQALIESSAVAQQSPYIGSKQRPEGLEHWQQQQQQATADSSSLLSGLCLMPPAGHPWPLHRVAVPTALLSVLLRAFAAESNASPAHVVCRASLPPPPTAAPPTTRHVSVSTGGAPAAPSQPLATTTAATATTTVSTPSQLRLGPQPSGPPAARGGHGHGHHASTTPMHGATAVASSTPLAAAAATRSGFLVSGLWLRDVDLPGMTLPLHGGGATSQHAAPLVGGGGGGDDGAGRGDALLSQAPVLLVSAGLMEGVQRRAMRVLRSGSPGMGAVRAGGGVTRSGWIQRRGSDPAQHADIGAEHLVGSGGDCWCALLGEVVLAVQWDSRAAAAAAAAQGLGVGNWATLSALPMMVTSDPTAIGGDDAGHVMRLARGWAMADGPRGAA